MYSGAPTEPFFTTKPDRDGVGLTIAQGIWRRHRGALSIDSRPGQGTTIRLSIGPLPKLEPANPTASGALLRNDASKNAWLSSELIYKADACAGVVLPHRRLNGMIVIIDYGMGNLRSVQKAIEAVGAPAEITSDPRVARASKVILPGVGAFADAMAELRRTGLGEAFCAAVQAGKPCLGVCLGLQLLFDSSTEDGEHTGLGLLPGRRGPVPGAAGARRYPTWAGTRFGSASRPRCWPAWRPSPRFISSTRITR